MAELKELRQRFYKDLVAFGVERPPQEELRKWVERFRAPLQVKGDFRQSRLANGFSIGCGAELMLTNKGRFMSPNNWHLGRWGFIRGQESTFALQIPKQRSCLQLVAGLLKAFHYLAQIARIDQNDVWHSGCRWGDDSLTGTMYLGRLGSNRLREITALDAVYGALLQAKVFDSRQNTLRLAGDSKFRRKGMFGDITRHHFGYAYHSFPSFMQSPFQAMLTLTLAKLAVLSAEEVSNWLYVEGNAEAKILNLLAKYKGLDDDARLVYWILAKQGFPKTDGQLRDNWGITAEQPIELRIPPPKELPIENLWIERAMRLCRGEQPDELFVKLFWKQTELPGMGFYNHAYPKISKLLWGLKCRATELTYSEDKMLVVCGIPLSALMREKISHRLQCKIKVATHEKRIIRIPEYILDSPVLREVLKEILCSKTFGFYAANAKEAVVPEKVKQSRTILYQ